MLFPPSVTLGTILHDLPDCFRSEHKVVEIMRAYRFKFANPLWPKQGAMRAHFQASMEIAEASGHGNKAQLRRLKILAKHLP